MLWAVLGSALVGAAMAAGALRLLPERFPAPRLAVPTGLVGALLGGVITRWVVGPGDPALPLVAALLVAAAAMSLLIRSAPPAAHPRRRPARTA